MIEKIRDWVQIGHPFHKMFLKKQKFIRERNRG